MGRGPAVPPLAPPLLTSRDLVEYIVFDLEVGSSKVTMCGTKYVLADVQVVRKSDFGMNDTRGARGAVRFGFEPKSHPNRKIKIHAANRNDPEYDKQKGHIPEVILIKKIGEDEEKNWWKLLSCSHSMEFDDEVGADYDLELPELLNDLELLADEDNIEE
ncbi:hypothetical protein TSUD_185700 [Trifolium subterraneum]|uniref:60S ribosomal export protein NMD3 OB-fold domain-containing protein n=1 Tax=Trifolium subterraneum TaxID=3900 RepID=A0A2Z6LP22_TRISU|nr:hypothetical protein TSUD_185700 [Trifolium subterraneum]